MPVMGGLEAAPQLKKILPDTRIILFTLFGENLSQAALHNAGVTMVVSKSESLEALIKKARGLFHN
jgi:CheY-like chemotaxis protein